MSHQAFLTLGALAFVWPAAGLAGITASELWQVWQGDGAVSVDAAQQERREDGLSLTGVTLKSGGNGDRGSVLIERLELTDTGDGSVEIEVPDPVRFTGGGLPEDAALVMDYSDAGIAVSRSDDRVRYALDAPQVSAALTGAEGEALALDYVLNDVEISLETGAQLDQPMSLQSSVVRVEGTVAAVAQPDRGGGRVTFSAADLQGAMTADRPDMLMNAEFTAVLADFDTSTAFTDLALDIDGDSPQGPVQVRVGVGAGQIASAARNGVISSDVDTRDIVVGMTGGDLPAMPDAVSIGTLAYSATLPVAVDRDGPLRLRLTADDIAPAETVWSLIDPDRQLPRDPASLTLSLSATARPGAATGSALGARMPFEISAFDLQDLSLSVLGAQVTGSGQIDRPLDQMGAEGQVTLVATGLLELIGTLAALGLLPPQHELGARMGLAFATVPLPDGAGLKTELRFGPDGAIRLNGMQVR